MLRNIFLFIFVIFHVSGELKDGDTGVCKRNGRLSCCTRWSYNPSNKTCVPQCKFGCGEGRCVGPNECECDQPLNYQNKRCVLLECDMPYCIKPVCSYRYGSTNVCNCSEGYELRNDSNCVPICTRGCINGHCVAPDMCSCYDGYKNITVSECAPACLNCENGECIAPNVCACNNGYTKQEDVCKPICKDCNNGVCIAPDRCACEEGYKNDENGKCVPICDNCDNGECVAPDVCKCKNGYEKRDDTCSPICNKCTNGRCVLPNVCQCNTGYMLYNNECTPHCAEPCTNGFCSAPDTCTCDKGYQTDANDKICKPICTKKCINATCVRPEECKCLDGYIKSNDFVCKPKCTCGNGRCIESDGVMICMCNEGFNMVNGSCRPVCPNRCVNGFCTEPDVCSCVDGYSSNATHPWICTRPCASCINGTCNIRGECVCHPGFENINNNCTPMVVDCGECESFCNSTGCWCNDSRRCARPVEAKIDSEPTSTGLAGLQMLWLAGAVGAIVLVTTVIFIFRHMWKRQQNIRSKETAADSYTYGSVAYTVPGTLQSQTPGAASVPNLYSEEEDREEDEQREAADNLLPANNLENVA